METFEPASSNASRLRWSAETVESRRIRWNAPFFTYSGVAVCGVTYDRALPNFSKDLNTVAPQDPFRPTNKTRAHETTVVLWGREGRESSASIVRDTNSTSGANCGPLDMQ